MTSASLPDPAGWSDAASWLARARRSGSLRYSDLGARPVLPPEPLEELAVWLVDAADRWWYQAGRPDPFTLVVDSADDGTLARRFLQLGPECLPCLRYVLVHPDPAPPVMAALLGLEDPAYLFPVVAPGGENAGGRGVLQGAGGGEDAEVATGVGPLVTRVSGLPAVPGSAVVVAVSTLSRLPSDRVDYRDGRWEEVHLTATPAGGLVEVNSPLGAESRPLVLEDPTPGRYAVLGGAVTWLREALSSEIEGLVVVVDDWSAASSPMEGDEVPPLALDQLARIRPPARPRPEPVAGPLAVVVWSINPAAVPWLG